MGPSSLLGTGRKQSRGDLPFYMTYSNPSYTISQVLDRLHIILSRRLVGAYSTFYLTCLVIHSGF